MQATDFGENFVWGVATSAYQTEGASLVDGKGPSIWDAFCAKPGRIHQFQNANISCDFYNRYIQDLILMHYMGIQAFRFSISWPRIFPEGSGRTNEKGLDFYDRLIDFCLEMGIEPWVTLYHWDLPYELELKGGWTNREILNWFTDYVETCVNRYSDRVKHWMVLNEPMVFAGAGYFLGMHAPGKKGLSNFLAAAHHAVLCQALGGRIIKSIKGSLDVGTTFSASHIEPLDRTRPNIDAAFRTDVLVNRMFVEPLIGLGYPAQDFKILQQIEKYIQQGDEQLMKFDMDFIGVQTYTREIVHESNFIPYLNARIVKAGKRGVETTTMNWEVYPESIYHILKKYAAYGRIKKLIITENGAAFPDKVQAYSVNDQQRIRFLQSYLQQVLRAKEEGVPVEGYFVWTFTDNFEWAEGYAQRFGLVYTDYTTQKRIIKASGYWYQQFLKGVSNFTKAASAVA